MKDRMEQEVELGCRCGQVHGWVRGVSPSTVNRVFCYCDDCQAYLHFLERADLLDLHGGTDVVQVAPGNVAFDRGTERIVGLRLTPKGLHRWYASCCKTPLGNTLTPSLPFIGMPLEVLRGAADANRRDELFGKVRGAAFVKFAMGDVPTASIRTHLLLVRFLAMVLGWKLRGKSWPHPFFDRATGTPSHPVATLSQAEREALRPKCGPMSSATAEPTAS
jgi:hypothetical protein